MSKLSIVRETSAPRKLLPQHPASAFGVHIKKNVMHQMQKVSGCGNKSILLGTYFISVSEWPATVPC